MPFNHLTFCHPLLLQPLIFLSIRVFSDESVLHIRWPKCWSFSFSISPSNEYSGLISFRMDWLDLLAIQGTLKSLLQHHNLKASVLNLLYSPTLTSAHDYWKNPDSSLGEEFACSAGNPSSIPGLGRCPEGGHVNPLQYSCLENTMDRGAWRVQSIALQRIRQD